MSLTLSLLILTMLTNKEAFIMSYVCQVTEEAKIEVLCIHTRSSVETLPMVLGQCYGELMTYMQVHGVGMKGAPYVAYYNMDMNDLDIEVGVAVSKPAEGNERIKSETLPEGRYISTLHVGPYKKIEPAYRALMSYMEEHNLKATGVAYEFYLNDPQDTLEENLETKVLFKLND